MTFADLLEEVAQAKSTVFFLGNHDFSKSAPLEYMIGRKNNDWFLNVVAGWYVNVSGPLSIGLAERERVAADVHHQTHFDNVLHLGAVMCTVHVAHTCPTPIVKQWDGVGKTFRTDGGLGSRK